MDPFKLYLFDPDDGLGDPPGGGDPNEPPAGDPNDPPAGDPNEPPVTDDELADAGAVDFSEMFARPEFAQALEGALGNVLGGLANATPPDPGYGEPTLPDLPDIADVMYDPDQLAAYLEARDQRNQALTAQALGQVLHNIIGPYQSVWEKDAQTHWEQETDAYYGNLEKQIGPADHATVRAIAAGLDALGAVPAGQNAHEAGYRQLAELLKQAKLQGVEEYKQSLSRDSHLLEPPSSGSGVRGENAPTDELSAARAWAARRTAPSAA